MTIRETLAQIAALIETLPHDRYGHAYLTLHGAEGEATYGALSGEPTSDQDSHWRKERFGRLQVVAFTDRTGADIDKAKRLEQA